MLSCHPVQFPGRGVRPRPRCARTGPTQVRPPLGRYRNSFARLVRPIARNSSERHRRLSLVQAVSALPTTSHVVTTAVSAREEHHPGPEQEKPRPESQEQCQEDRGLLRGEDHECRRRTQAAPRTMAPATGWSPAHLARLSAGSLSPSAALRVRSRIITSTPATRRLPTPRTTRPSRRRGIPSSTKSIAAKYVTEREVIALLKRSIHVGYCGKRARSVL